MVEGRLRQLAASPGRPVRYRIELDEGDERSHALGLNSLLGGSLQITFTQSISCCYCGAGTPRSYGGGYCYDCFRTLARCDLCVVSPDRCHFAAGTCREPQWGQAFCMQPHVVYLANSSGPKVGITRQGGELTRWIDQGARQGLVVATADTRRQAGLLEVAIARQINDRTDWRALLHRDTRPIDLPALRDSLRPRTALPAGTAWVEDGIVQTVVFPVAAYPRRLVQLDFESGGALGGRLLGIKGQYLLFEHGAFNVRRYRGYHVRLEAGARGLASAVPEEPQMELF